MAIMVINVLWQVFTRFILANPSQYTEELARYLLIWLGLLGASYASSRGAHLAIDYFTAKFTGRTKLYSDLFIQLCVFVFALSVLVLGGLRLVALTISLEQVSAALQINLGYVYFVLPLSGLLIMFYSGSQLLEHLLALSGKGMAPDSGQDTSPTVTLD